MRAAAILIVCASCGAATPAVAPPPAAALAPCHVEGVTEPLRCGKLAVWEDRAARRGRQIELNVVVVPSTSPTPARDPVFAFAGGPGDAATNQAGGWAEDPVTPPRWADAVVRGLPHGLRVTIPEGHHGAGGLSHPECIAGLQATFLERGTTAGLDTSCVAEMRRPPFVTDAAALASLFEGAE